MKWDKIQIQIQILWKIPENPNIDIFKIIVKFMPVALKCKKPETKWKGE